MGVIGSAWTALRLYLMRRNQFENVKLRNYFRERHDVDVGLYSYGCFDRWRMRGPMTVGRYCSIAQTVRTVLDNHPLDALTTHPALYEKQFGVVAESKAWTGRLVIEDDVWIGHNAIIMPGCQHIGRGAVIGAGAIVTRNVDAYTVVAGNPARKLRDRFPPDLVEAIEASRWWELSLKELGNLARERPEVVFHPGAESLRAWALSRR